MIKREAQEELIKLAKQFNQANRYNLYFWRDNTGHEVDIIIETMNKLFPVEIKSGKTITDKFFEGLLWWFKISGEKSGAIVYAGETGQKRSNGIEDVPWNSVKSFFPPSISNIKKFD